MAAGETGATWDRRYGEEAWPDEPDDALVELVAGLTPGDALDLACGPGRNAVFLAENGWSVTGVDASPVGLALASTRAAAAGVALRLVEADLRTWRPQRASAALVVVANLHLPPGVREPFFGGVVEALRPGGHAFVLGHHQASPGRPCRVGVEDGYTPALLADLLAPCRVEIRQVDRPRHDGRPASRKLAAWATRPHPGTDPGLC